jgi:acetyl-CoA acetyltransferase
LNLSLNCFVIISPFYQNDGAAAIVLVSAGNMPNGTKPVAKVVAFAEASLAPVDFTVAPVNAVKLVCSSFTY